MRDDLTILRDLLTPKTRTQGVVTAITGERLTVSTPSGPRVLDRPASLLVSIGTTVRIDGEIISGKIRSESDLPIYKI